VAVVEISGLIKRYGDLEAVAGVDLTVEKGEVFGLLGPNGAGKTTIVEILESSVHELGPPTVGSVIATLTLIPGTALALGQRRSTGSMPAACGAAPAPGGGDHDRRMIGRTRRDGWAASCRIRMVAGR
jgi:ABC-2 type transport system ATP-binding protein